MGKLSSTPEMRKMGSDFKWLILLSLMTAQIDASRRPTPPVRVSNGLLRGSYTSTHKQYLGIPYATVTKRFEAPGPEPKWEGVFEADNALVLCKQAIRGTKITIGREDCLILNVFVPLDTEFDKKNPVLLYIKGGSFKSWSSSSLIFGAEYLVRKKVILVTINYRLGAFGYMCLGVKGASGNMGMKDQVAALRWVQRNIRQFGGDPDNVTIMGQSAGAASVSMHVLSPMSKQLFHKAIVQGGSSLSTWAFRRDPIKSASLQARELGFNSTDPHKLYEFFMGRTDTELLLTEVPREKGTTNTQTEILYAPCAEKKIDGEEAFLTDLPYDILKNGSFNKVPMILGSNTEEGLLFAAFDDRKYFENVDFEIALPLDLEFPSNETRKAVAKKVREFYLGDKEISRENMLEVSRLYGEPYNNYAPVEETNLIMQSSDQPLWHYLFGYSGNRNFLRLVSGLRYLKEHVATHGDELFYEFRQPVLPILSEMEMIERMTTMITNFAKYGDPTPTTSELLPVKWPAVKLDDQRALYIDREFKTIPLWYRDSLLYWREVYSKYRKHFDKDSIE